MANVIAVHGIGQQQSGRNQMLGGWNQAVQDGIERAGPDPEPVITFNIAFYGDLFLDETGLKGGTADDLDDDELAFFEEVEAELVDDDAPALKAFPRMRGPAARLGAWLEAHFGVAGRLLFFADLRQVRRYQRDDVFAARIRARVDKVVDEETRVLIGHSLGSVVAYEFACLNAASSPPPTLITLGSPLGLRSVQKALRTNLDVPAVEHWLNVVDPRDVVTLALGLNPTWDLVRDARVDNGKDAHAAMHYLGKRATGEAVAAGV